MKTRLAPYGKLGAIVPFTALDGASATDVWVAAGPLLKHWDGTAWSDPTVLPPAGTDIRMIRAFSPTDVWISGSETFHFDGATWVSWGTRTWLDIQSNGTTTYAVGVGAIGIAQGASFYLANGNAFPCSGATSTTGNCTSAYMPATGELFLGIQSPNTNGFFIGPYQRPANGYIRSFDGTCWKDELSTNGGAVITGNQDRLWVWGPKLTGGTPNDLRTPVP